MKICDLCCEEIWNSSSCIQVFERQIQYGYERDYFDLVRHYVGQIRPCPGCGIAKYGFHHRGCENEECPDCHQKLLKCPHREMKKAREPDWEC